MSNDLRFDKPLSPTAQLITEGKGTRLQLTADSRIETIAAKWREKLGFFESLSTRFVCVKVIDAKGNIRELAINVNSFAKRFNLERAEARKLLKQYNTLEQLDSLVQSAVQAHEDTGSLISRVFKRLAHLITKKSDSSFTRNIKLLVLEDKKQAVLIGNLLGKGGYGEVFAASDLAKPVTEAPEVLKRALRSQDKSVEHEYSILCQVNPQGLPGLQLPPRKVVRLCSPDADGALPGYLAPRYDKNLGSTTLSSFNETHTALFQLTDGLNRLHEHKMFHGDIKTSNMLHIPGRYDLADLGGAKSYDSIRSHLLDCFQSDEKSGTSMDYTAQKAATNRIWGSYVPTMIHRDDLKALFSTVKSAHQKFQQASNDTEREQILKEATDEILVRMQARDAYALGLSFDNLTYGLVSCLLPEEEGSQVGEQIVKCVNAMMTTQPSAPDGTSYEVCKTRLKGMQTLLELLRPTDEGHFSPLRGFDETS